MGVWGVCEGRRWQKGAGLTWELKACCHQHEVHPKGSGEGGGGGQEGVTWDPRARQPSARGTLWRGEAMAPVKPYKALAVNFKAFCRESRIARVPADYTLITAYNNDLKRVVTTRVLREK